MDLAKTLIRSVVRAFYETKHVLVIDALMVHSASVLPIFCFVLPGLRYLQAAQRGSRASLGHATEGSA